LPPPATVIYSPDGDLLSLSMLTHIPRLHVMRIPDTFLFPDTDLSYIYCHIDHLERTLADHHRIAPSQRRVWIENYNVLLALTGNDFIHSLSYLKIRAGGLDRLLKLFSSLRGRRSVSPFSLVDSNGQLSWISLLELFEELANTEYMDMNREWKRYLRESRCGSSVPFGRKMHEDPMEQFESDFQHLSFFHPLHPLYSQYGNTFRSISLDCPSSWKRDFRAHFFPEEEWTPEVQRKIVISYLQSLEFTWKYYTEQCPSFRWYYPYRTAPLASDIVEVLSPHRERLELFLERALSFSPDERKPYRPFEQLLYILPPSMHRDVSLPAQLISGIDVRQWPDESNIRLDALAGGKFIYSEILFPPDSPSMMDLQFLVESCSSSFSQEERCRNHRRFVDKEEEEEEEKDASSI